MMKATFSKHFSRIALAVGLMSATLAFGAQPGMSGMGGMSGMSGMGGMGGMSAWAECRVCRVWVACPAWRVCTVPTREHLAVWSSVPWVCRECQVWVA